MSKSSSAGLTAVADPLIQPPRVGQHSHLIQFYESDQDLASSVARFIGAGLAQDEAGLVIATPAHSQLIRQELRLQGHDLGSLDAKGQLLSLDAASTLAKFMVSGQPHAQRFQSLMGSQIQSLLSRFKGLRAFGEMVGLLRDHGNDPACLRLEELWHPLTQLPHFSLLCGYNLDSFAGPQDARVFQAVCERHSQVLPSEASLAGSRKPGLSLALLQRENHMLRRQLRASQAPLTAKKKVKKSVAGRVPKE